MRRYSFGVTLIELMIVLAVLAILVSIAYPSYQTHVRKGLRSAGQQFLMDIAQRQEQYLLDNRAYATVLGTTSGGLNMQAPDEISGKYNAPTFTVDNTATPPTFVITLAPSSSGPLVGDGTLIINNLQQRWRETDGNLVYGTNDCLWEDSGCTPH